ncbi:phosphotransferase family protein [Pseudomaricurvus alcaniphilus]|uniref:phosphotransferase family protein n=1 Tax=Pseudomaricurvus alcaniphilus TaxID=1166482 RepID=UPI00140E0662|nr:phosphotransferase family protein [Pseudomaricurvus alcaniphilus]NHN37822.1 phosphotransferase family protein [Pseudomaricurvus alcaniphilus]
MTTSNNIFADTISEETARYLNTVRNAIANDLRPTIEDDTGRRVADALNLVLGRLIERLSPARNVIATEHMAEWENIQQELDELCTNNNASPGLLNAEMKPREKLEASLAQLQNTFSQSTLIRANGLVTEAHSKEWQWFRKAGVAAFSLWEEIENGVNCATIKQAEDVAASSNDTICSKLEQYLRNKYPQLPEIIITNFTPYYGGYVKQMAKVTLVANDALPSTIVLRRDLAMSFTGTRSFDEFPVMERVYSLGLPVPRPILAEEDETILGGSFLLMEEVANVSPAGAYFAKERKQEPVRVGPGFCQEIASTMATLHSKTALTEHSIEQRQQARAALLEEISALQAEWQSISRPPMSIAVDLGFEWLLQRPLPDNRPCGLVHADCGMHNYLVRDGHLVAVVDWELAHQGDPAEDLAMIRMMVAGDVFKWEDFVTQYVGAGGDANACDPEAVAYYSILLFTRHILNATRLRTYYHTGARDDAIVASVATHSIERLLQYQARALKFALDL